MNAPERFELFVLPDGVKKVSIIPDSKVPNAASFIIEKEDHTLGNMLRMQLLKDSRVLFAGYKVPHPLNHNILVKIQTIPNSSPTAVLYDAIAHLFNELHTLKTRLQTEVLRHKNEVTLNDDYQNYQADVDF